MKVWFLLLILTVLGGFANAQEVYRRNVDFEWEASEGAKAYDLELTLVNADKLGKPVVYKSEEPHFSGPLVPGDYQMRIRSRDLRGVPGAWGAPEQFKVGLDNAKIVSPKKDSQVDSKEKEKADVVFEWQKVGGAESYQLDVTSDDKSFTETKNLEKTKIEITLPVAKKYSWQVKAVGKGLESDGVTPQEFTLLGKRIERPKFKKPENDFIRDLSWNASENSEAYVYTLTRLVPATKKWEVVSAEQETAETKIPFDPKLSGGRYRIAVKAKANNRITSETSQLEFPVRNGDRSPEAEEIATIRESIERLSGWYGVASYLITQVNYDGINFDSNSFASFRGVGGTGRLGLGYLSSKTAWGFLGTADMSGIYIEGNGNHTFASVALDGIYRLHFGDRGELRQQGGLFVREIPELIRDNQAGTLKQVNQLQFAGPHYGIEYWYAVTNKFGLQLNGHVYLGALKLKTPNSQGLEPSLSMQYGILGSYRIKKNVTGLIGYAYRKDEVKYKSSDDSVSPGAANRATLEGNYLNLFLEWAL